MLRNRQLYSSFAENSFGVHAAAMAVEIVFFVAIVVLFLGIVAGYLQYRRRSAATDALTEAATRDLYKQSDVDTSDAAKLR